MGKLSDDEINQNTYDRISDMYARRNYQNMNMAPQLDRFLELIPKGGKILDLGCGPGHDTNYMIEKGYELTGVDFSKEMIKIARKRCLKGEFIEQDIRKFPIPKDEYDGIWCNSVLLHFQDEEKASMLSKMHSGLKNDGIMHVSFSEGDGRRVSNREIEGLMDAKVYYDIGEKEAKELVKKSGFEIVFFKKELFKITFMIFVCKKV